ncbi:MAG TPA: Na+/H+ antiporter NhaC family protein, partial [Tissierellaceae bacterium]|nr:Na+/H+ antiporter NhaC family protein [Tissierellaceae bacterium]
IIMAMIFSVFVLAQADEESRPAVYSTIWSLLPPVIAIGLALLTKEVYSSLFIGIMAGALLAENGNPVNAFTTMVGDGFISSLSDEWNVGILMFLVILGIMIVVMNRAGGSKAYGEWASTKISTRKGAMGATFGLGVLIFIDDYFNCLTVGSVMRPVTDNHNISRAKLAYLIDSTAAPICMIAPISSWAAAVTGVVEGYHGLELFIKAIPYNFYSLLTLVMILFIIIRDLDYGPMRKYERNAVLHGDIFTDSKTPFEDEIQDVVSDKGGVIDLVLPILVLIALSVIGMIYTGGFFEGESFIDAFANSDASFGLAMGSLLALIFTFVWIVARKVLSFSDFMECIVEGFNAMVPPILILTFAWTLSSMTGLLGAAPFVANIVEGSAAGFQAFLPAIIFLVAAFLAFSTGTSWGTFGILIPIVVGLGAALSPKMLVIGISATLAGAVFGDHTSPISDTTIMASTGAQVDHIVHVTTQIPYALTVAGVSFVTYIIAGFTESIVALPIGIVLMIGTLLIIEKMVSKKGFSEIHEEMVEN